VGDFYVSLYACVCVAFAWLSTNGLQALWNGKTDGISPTRRIAWLSRSSGHVQGVWWYHLLAGSFGSI
jgi:hypothetical protein